MKTLAVSLGPILCSMTKKETTTFDFSSAKEYKIIN